MMHRVSRWVAAGAVLVFTMGATGARPARQSLVYRVVIFSGRVLMRRVALTDSGEVADLLDAVQNPVRDTTRRLSYRPYLDVALFVDDPISPAVPLARVSLDRADAHARFYPADGDEAPFWVFGSDAHETPAIRYVLQRGLDLLQRHGIPVRVQPGG